MPECDRDDCGGMAKNGHDYCRHHIPDDAAPETDDDSTDDVSPRAVALDHLVDLVQHARSEPTQVRAAEVILRWGDD